MSRHSTKTVLMVVLALTASTLTMSPVAAQPGRVEPAKGPAPSLAPPANDGRPEPPPLPPVLAPGDGGLLSQGGPPLSAQLQPPVEGPDLSSETTTATSRHRVDRDGKGTAELYLKPTFRKKLGRWVEIDSTPRRNANPAQPVSADGALRPVRFGTSPRRILELGLDKGPVTMSSPDLKLSKPSLEANKVLYRDVATDTDLRYALSDEGVKEELVLRSPAAPRSFTFRLSDPSGQLGALSPDGAGGFAFANPVEEGVSLTLPPALAWEQKPDGEPVTNDPSSATLSVVPAGDGWDLTVSVEDSWLEGKSFPVVLDPSLTYSANSGTGPTMEGYAIRDTSSCGTSCGLTRNSYLFAGSWGWANPVRSYLRYNLSSIPSGARIDSARFNAYIASCMNTTPPDPCANKSWSVTLNPMTADWNAASTYGQLAAATSGASSPFPITQRSDIPGWTSWPFLEYQVQRWVDGSEPNYGFSMISGYGGESPDKAGLAYASSRWPSASLRPYLSISYSVVAPGTPAVAAYPGNGAARVYWGVPRSGGTPIDHYLVQAYRGGAYAGARTVSCPCAAALAYGGLTNGTSYSFKVYAHNSIGYSSAASSAAVTPSASLPTAPTPAWASPGNAAATASWSPPSTGTAGVDHYAIEVYDTLTGYVGAIGVYCPCPTTAPVGVLANGRSYILAVHAHTSAGYSVPAISGVVTPSANLPGQPGSVVAQGEPSAAQVSWQAPSITGGSAITRYSVKAYDTETGYLGDAATKALTCPCTSLATRVDGLTPGRTYVFAVTAANANGWGSPGLSGRTGLARLPGAPSALAAVPGDGRAALSWDAAEANGSPVSAYTITASPGGATMNVTGATSAMFEGLTNDTAYTFAATATNAGGTSTSSAPSNQVTPSSDRSLLGPLVAPSDVMAIRGDTSAQVTWTEPTLTLPLLTSYQVTTHRASDGVELGTTPAGTGSGVTVTGLRNGTPVYFTVTATNLGLLPFTSEASNTITPAGPPFAPTDVVATRGDGQVEVRWSPPGPRPDGTPGDNGDPISGYTVTAFRASDTTEVSTIEGATTPLVVDGLTNGTTYYFKVRATNGVGTGPDSASSNTVTPAGPPFPPTNVNASLVAPGQAEVSWTAPEDNGSPITSYTVTASPGGASLTVPDPLTSAIIDGLQQGTTYTFTVVATNDVGDSDPSAPSDPLTVAEPPSTPMSVTATARDGAAVVQWSASDGNGAPITYTVTASPGGASRTTMATSTVVDGLTNGVEYTFTVQASNSAGTSTPSGPSNAVNPRVATSPPPPSPDDSCENSTLPNPPAEVYLPSGAVQRQIEVPCRPEMGQVRVGFFIEDEEVQAVPDIRVVGDGDGRSFDPNMEPDDNRIYLELDYLSGTGFIQSNRSCKDRTETECAPAISLRDTFESYSRADGSIFINFTIGNSLQADTPGLQRLKISADLDILPIPGGLVCVTGAVSRFPAVESYYDHNGIIGEEFALHQSDYGVYALAAPDRNLPPCLSREMP